MSWIASLPARVFVLGLVLCAPSVFGKMTSGPNILLAADEISALAESVQKSNEAAAMLRAMREDADRYLAAPPPTVVSNGGQGDEHGYYTELPYCGWFNFWGLWGDSCRDGEINPDADREDYNQARRMARETVVLALTFRLLGEADYGHAAARNIRVWTIDSDKYLRPQFTTSQSYIELCVTQIATIYAISLLWETDLFSATERGAIESWVAQWGNSIESWQRSNNFEDWRIAMRLAIYGFTGNANKRHIAVSDFKRRIKEVVGDQGELLQELNRTKSLEYSLFALNAMAHSAEIARHQGIDLYNYTDERGVGLKKIFDYHLPFAMEKRSTQWPFPQSQDIAASDVAVYELAFSRYGDPDYLDLIQRWGRPLIEIRTFQYISLSHGSPY